MGKKMHEELGIVVWIDYSGLNSKEKTVVKTITHTESKYPRAFPINQLTAAVPNSIYATSEDFRSAILTSSDQNPVVISLKTAEEHLGWEDFDVPPSFLE